MIKWKVKKTTDELAFPDVNNFLYTSPTVETAFDGQLIRLGVIVSFSVFPII